MPVRINEITITKNKGAIDTRGVNGEMHFTKDKIAINKKYILENRINYTITANGRNVNKLYLFVFIRLLHKYSI